MSNLAKFCVNDPQKRQTWLSPTGARHIGCRDDDGGGSDAGSDGTVRRPNNQPSNKGSNISEMCAVCPNKKSGTLVLTPSLLRLFCLNRIHQIWQTIVTISHGFQKKHCF